jgi:hypothetical protein
MHAATHHPAFCTLGIAATIQHDWATTRDARESFGVSMPAGEAPTIGNFGQASMPGSRQIRAPSRLRGLCMLCIWCG